MVCRWKGGNFSISLIPTISHLRHTLHSLPQAFPSVLQSTSSCRNVFSILSLSSSPIVETIFHVRYLRYIPHNFTLTNQLPPPTAQPTNYKSHSLDPTLHNRLG